MARVLIGIQARSTSTRLPRKPFELIGSKRCLDHVIDAALSAQRFLMRVRSDLDQVDVAVLTPEGDSIVDGFMNRCPIIQGPEHDVLSRYVKAAKDFEADFIVRLTGDCPLIPDFIVSKLVQLASANRYDYVSNVHEDYRTSIDGHDCEVLSRRLLDHLQGAAVESYDREHVTTLARRTPPVWCRTGFVINYHDHSALKLSVDTTEDLERVRGEYERRETKLYTAERKFGKNAVHRL